MAEKGIALGPEGPTCAACGGLLPADGMQVLVTVTLYTDASVDADGTLSFEDPRKAFDFDWDLVEAECPHCGHTLTEAAVTP